MSSGIWIKMRRSITSDPDILMIANLTKLDRFSVVGRLHAIWSWADEHGVAERNAVSVTGDFLDHVADCDGFVDAMRQVGWLAGDDGALEFPDFGRHNGSGAKKRAQNAKRSKDFRSKHQSCKVEIEASDSNAVSVTNALPDKTRRRQDKEGRREPAGAGVSTATFDEFVDTWNAAGLTECRRLTDIRRKKLRNLLSDSDWKANWQSAIATVAKLPFCCGTNDRGWRADVDWFLKPDTVTQILEGKFDDRQAGESAAKSAPQVRLNKAQREHLEGKQNAEC